MDLMWNNNLSVLKLFRIDICAKQRIYRRRNRTKYFFVVLYDKTMCNGSGSLWWDKMTKKFAFVW
jgi:hypothetical protein